MNKSPKLPKPEKSPGNRIPRPYDKIEKEGLFLIGLIGEALTWLQTGNPFLLEKSEEYVDKGYFEDINASSRSDGRQV